VTIVLADDHLVVRLGLRSLLEAQRDLQVVAEAADGLEAVRLCERLRPDVLVVDLMMPGVTGLEAIRQVRQLSPRTRVVVLSSYSTENYVVQAFRNGASGYVLKSALPTELVQAVRDAAAGKHYLSEQLPEMSMAAFFQGTDEAAADPYETLTPREREVVQLAASGHSNRQIANELHIGERTVETHRARAMGKLDLHSQAELVRFALRRGMLAPEEMPPR
jgi:DNA-binding NarL/FixJ family response regulator